MGYADIHNHMMPGVDDGSRSMAMTRRMLEVAHEEDIDTIIITPHYKHGHKHVDPAEIERFAIECTEYAEYLGYEMTFYPGNELQYFSDADKRLEAGYVRTLAGSDYCLVEFDPRDHIHRIKGGIRSLTYAGYRPVLAHIERYECMLENFGFWQDIADMGCLIQVNSGSVTGDYGMKMRAYTHRLLKEGAVDLIATDAHRDDIRAPRMKKCADLIYKKCSRKYADDLLKLNALRIIENKDI